MAKPVPARMPGRPSTDAALDPAGSNKTRSPGQSSGTDPTALECARAFSHSRQPVLIVDCTRGIIVHANAAAARVIGARKTALVGSPLRKYVLDTNGCDIPAMLDRVRPTGSAFLAGLRTAADDKSLDAAVSLVRSTGQDYLLLRPRAAQRAPAAESFTETSVSESVDAASMGLVVTDAERSVLYANRTFVRQIGLAFGAEAVGRPLGRWIRLTERDLTRLREQMASRQAVISLMTRLVDETGSARLVHVLAIAVPDGPRSHWGFVLTGRGSIN